nr:uncharacterized protein LOC129453317 [Misgurnus anguillicaudatus]
MEFLKSWLVIYIVLLLSAIVSSRGHDAHAVLTYTRDQLLTLQDQAGKFEHLIPMDCTEILKQHKGRWTIIRKNTKAKKRGSRGGVRARLRRRGSRFPLPVITLSNVRSLNNKVEELAARVNFETDFKLCNLICLTETWLKPETAVYIDGYTTIRADRDELLSRKSIGGGLCIFMDNKWATQMHIQEQVCTPEYEILTVSFRPFYLPREFGQITIILTYVPGTKHQEAAGRWSFHSPERGP